MPSGMRARTRRAGTGGGAEIALPIIKNNPNKGDDVYIAGTKTVADWNAFRPGLALGGDRAVWTEAFQSYFHARLSLRYLDPIRVLQDNGTYQGEGFSIVAIQCTLIEFLESTVQGRSYRYRRRGDPPVGPHEYSNSSELFVSFLSTRQAFAKDFDAQLAHDFYEGVRCGLLHEARTKGGWTIWAKRPQNCVGPLHRRSCTETTSRLDCWSSSSGTDFLCSATPNCNRRS